jgi:hypothetical protein
LQLVYLADLLVEEGGERAVIWKKKTQTRIGCVVLIGWPPMLIPCICILWKLLWLLPPGWFLCKL